MSKGLTIQVEGLSKALADINRYNGVKSRQISEEIKATAYEIEADAKAAAPNDLGQLRQFTRVVSVTRNNAAIEAQASYAAYVEFGTGTGVNVPRELTSYAMQFKGKGIRKVNLPARPFFFPAVMKNMRQMVENIEKILSRR